MPKTDICVKDLVQMVRTGELQLPEMQRQYVWTAPRVRDLLDSLYRGYPSGSLLVWETDQDLPSRALAVEQNQSPFKTHKLLLDGQQRLTSLASVTEGKPVSVRGRQRPIEILFNLDHPTEINETIEVEGDEVGSELDGSELLPEEEVDDSTLAERLKQRTFVVYSRSIAQDPRWVLVSDVFGDKSDWDILEKRVSGPQDPKYRIYSERLAKLRKINDYLYVMHVLDKNLSYEEVAEIFVRVNSLGVKLRGSDLALAQITSKWRNSLELFEQFQLELESSWFDLDLGVLIRSLVVFATQQSRFKTVTALSTDDLRAAWEQAKNGISFAVNFLRSNALIEDETLLSSPLFIICVAAFWHSKGKVLDREDERKLLKWLYSANAKGHFSRGSSESILDADLHAIFKEKNIDKLLSIVGVQFGRLNVEPVDFEGKKWRSPLCSAAFIAMKRNGAKDWRTGLEISLLAQGKQHFIEGHHVFPKSTLIQLGIDNRLVNDLSNFAFITSTTNKWISNRSPEIYLADILNQRSEEALISHCIPLNRDLWKLERFPDFLEERRKLLSQLINSHIDQFDASAGPPVEQPTT